MITQQIFLWTLLLYGVMMIGAILLAWKSLFTCGIDEALIRSGSGGVKVVIQKILFSFPLIHKLQRVSLRTVKFQIQAGSGSFQKPEAVDSDQESLAAAQRQESIFQIGTLRDREHLPVLLEVDIYLHIPPRENYIINAARTFGERLDPQHWEPIVDQATGINKESLIIQTIRSFAAEKLAAAVRDEVATMTLQEMNANRLSFTEHVTAHVEEDLKENGLAIESITIKSVDQAPL